MKFHSSIFLACYFFKNNSIDSIQKFFNFEHFFGCSSANILIIKCFILGTRWFLRFPREEELMRKAKNWNQPYPKKTCSQYGAKRSRKYSHYCLLHVSKWQTPHGWMYDLLFFRRIITLRDLIWEKTSRSMLISLNKHGGKESRLWQAAGLTDHVWTFRELLAVKLAHIP